MKNIFGKFKKSAQNQVKKSSCTKLENFDVWFCVFLLEGRMDTIRKNFFLQTIEEIKQNWVKTIKLWYLLLHNFWALIPNILFWVEIGH